MRWFGVRDTSTRQNGRARGKNIHFGTWRYVSTKMPDTDISQNLKKLSTIQNTPESPKTGSGLQWRNWASKNFPKIASSACLRIIMSTGQSITEQTIFSLSYNFLPCIYQTKTSLRHCKP